MDRLKSYIISKIIKNFLTLFLPFFALMSAIYIVNISRFSAKINLSTLDFFTLFSYTLPDILSTSIPLAFFGAIVNTFASLSSNSEITAIFALGYSPKKIAKMLLPTTLLLTITLLLLALIIKPITDQKTEIFKSKKIYEEKLKILPNKLSQHFANKHIFIERGNQNHFENITLFSKEKDNTTQILLAKTGNIVNAKPQSYLNLNNGTLYKNKDDSYTIINYKNLKLYNTQKEYLPTFQTIKNFWKSRKKQMQYHIFIAISPLILLLLLISVGIYNNRYEKNLSTLYLFAIAIGVYILAIFIRKNGNPIFIISFSILIFILSLIIFRNRLIKRY